MKAVIPHPTKKVLRPLLPIVVQVPRKTYESGVVGYIYVQVEVIYMLGVTRSR